MGMKKNKHFDGYFLKNSFCSDGMYMLHASQEMGNKCNPGPFFVARRPGKCHLNYLTLIAISPCVYHLFYKHVIMHKTHNTIYLMLFNNCTECFKTIDVKTETFPRKPLVWLSLMQFSVSVRTEGQEWH